MSNDTITVELQERSVVRKGLHALREEGMIPAVIHNHGKESIHVMGDLPSLIKTFSAAGKHHPVQLKVGGKQHLALIKDVDYEPAKHYMRHIVFQAINQNETVEAEIPVVFKEDAEIPAAKLSLMVLKQLDTVMVKALPNDLPDELVIDPSSLAEVGDSLSVADIKAPAGVTIMTEPDVQIAIVEMPKDQIAAADESAASLAEDAGTPEVEAVSGDAASDTKESTEEE